MILVGQVTAGSANVGSRELEHMVDTVLYVEGDQHSIYRLVRAIKNRYSARQSDTGRVGAAGERLARCVEPVSHLLAS